MQITKRANHHIALTAIKTILAKKELSKEDWRAIMEIALAQVKDTPSPKRNTEYHVKQWKKNPNQSKY